jgi:nitrite reductase/ring-hydroxylating ferredoxin subunit
MGSEKGEPSEAREATSATTALKCVARRSELSPSGQVSKWVDDHDLLIFEHHGKVKVLSNICPHLGGPVGYHKLKDGRFTCLWHNFQFSAESGQCIDHPKLCLREYKTEVRGDEIWVQLVENV